MRELLLIVGVVLAGAGLRSFAHPWLRRAGALMYLGATWLAAWLATGNYFLAAGAVSLWFFLPWLQILTHVRHLRLPLDKPLRSTFPPSADRFPQLGEMTSEITAAGFTQVDDTSSEWESTRQFMRLFYHEAGKTQAAICLLEQDEAALAWVSLSSRLPDGRTWTTWNYPFSHTMKLPPETRLHTILEADSFEDLQAAHRDFLARESVQIDDLAAVDPEEFSDVLQRETRRQVDHNLDEGLITLSGEGTFRYSFRGYLFLWRQFLRDMVRLS